jgi:hypothetical protein
VFVLGMMMDAAIRDAVLFDEGSLVLTDAHLLVMRTDGRIANSYPLTELSEVAWEERHSFRHRTLGLIGAVALLVPSLWALLSALLEGNLGALLLFGERLGVAIFFGLFFGMLFLCGVLLSRRICWLRLKSGKVSRLLPLPGAAPEDLMRMVDLLTVKRHNQTDSGAAPDQAR